jgi:leucyl aminopeptidase (aminopeptidase T)
MTTEAKHIEDHEAEFAAGRTAAQSLLNLKIAQEAQAQDGVEAAKAALRDANRARHEARVAAKREWRKWLVYNRPEPVWADETGADAEEAAGQATLLGDEGAPKGGE